MKRIIALAAAGLMATAAIPAYAQQDPLKQDSVGAQTAPSVGAEASGQADADIGTDMDSDMEAGASSDLDTDLDADAGIDPGTTAATGDANFGSVISSIRSGKMDTDFSAVTDEEKVEVVKVDSLTGADADPQALENAISQNQSEIDKLRTAIDENEAIKAKLEEENLASSDVVATEMEADGTVTVYVQ